MQIICSHLVSFGFQEDFDSHSILKELQYETIEKKIPTSLKIPYS